MFKSTRDFEAAMYEIMVKIRDGSNYNELSSKYGETDFYDALEHCFKRSFITAEGPPRKTEAGTLSFYGKPRITFEGLNFIENFN